jgi:ATP synthase protein I
MSPDPTQEPSPDDAAELGRREQSDAWNAFALIASGVTVWGGVGWLVSEWLDNRIYLMIGIIVGAAAALYLVWVRYGKA